MKIGPLDVLPVGSPAADRRGAVAATPAPVQTSAKVALSPAATGLAAAGSDPSFDAAKVERIAQAIRDGQFKVNPEAIADRLIFNAAELLGRRPS